jgi:hypothetical protein
MQKWRLLLTTRNTSNTVDKAIKRGFEKVKKLASSQEKKLVRQDIKRDKKCDRAERKAKRK